MDNSGKWFLWSMVALIAIPTVAFTGYNLHNDVRTERMYKQCLEAQKTSHQQMFCHIPR